MLYNSDINSSVCQLYVKLKGKKKKAMNNPPKIALIHVLKRVIGFVILSGQLHLSVYLSSVLVEHHCAMQGI